jgi:hypothetical protein
MRIRITARRLERLAAQFAPLPTDPRVLWIILMNTDLVGGDQEGLTDAIQDAVWDELAPLAMRGEILASLYVYDGEHVRVEAVGNWWDLSLNSETMPPAAEIGERGQWPWRQRLIGIGGDDAGIHESRPAVAAREEQPGRSSRQRQRSMAWLD